MLPSADPRQLAVLGLLTFTLWSAPTTASRADEGIDFFESRIRPVLVEHCYDCHSEESGKSKGGLLVDRRSSIRQGGDQGPAVVPGEPENSLLLSAISHADPDLTMPPKKPRLSDSIIHDLKRWIELGAPDPRDGTASVSRAPVDLASGREFWSLKRPVRHPLPKVQDKDWPRQDLDYFILSRLEEKGLKPSSDAPPHQLLRRLHFDLAGLPPSPAELESFLRMVERQGLETALEKRVDSLLASEAYGVRWGRHWLDVARYAESSGKESNLTFPHAWRYRDYVIESFQENKPFDRFLHEQLAGDLLPSKNPQERAQLLIATGFLALGTKGLNEMNRLQFIADLIDEQIDTLSRAILANSIACARCHDHKFDPYSMEDYYALAGIFASTETFFGTAIGSENNVGGDLITLPSLEGQLIPNRSIPPQQLEKLKTKLASVNEEEKSKKAAQRKAVAEGRDPSGLFTLKDALRILWTRGGLEGQLETVDEQGRALPLCMGAQDRARIVDLPVLERGDIRKPGSVVARRFPAVFQLDDSSLPGPDQSGRLELAHWLTHPDHPLTSRVLANRIWRWLIGQGIVTSVDNFGFNGQRPSHPHLLDRLSLDLLENGWSVRALARSIVLSRTYRQSSTWKEADFLQDPENTLLWRAHKQRLSAECIRDAMLTVSGNLDASPRPGSLIAPLGNRSVSLFGFDKRIPSDLDGSHYRSVYLPVIRDRLPDVLDLFDFAEPSLVTGDRQTTNVPVQALFLLNSPFVRKQAEGLASRLLREPASQEARIQRAFQICFSREPHPEERDRILSSLSHFQSLSSPSEPREAWTNLLHSLLITAEFRNLD